MNEIVVGVNRSERAERVAERAAQLAAAGDVTLYVVMCVDRSESGLASGDGYGSERAREHQRFLDDLCDRLPHRRTANVLASGDAVDVLCEEADRLGAQMIVVGNHRAQGVGSVLGSMARDVTRRAPCDVLIVNSAAA